MFSIIENTIFLLLFSLLPLILKLTTTTDEQKINDLAVTIVTMCIIYSLIKLPWDIFQSRWTRKEKMTFLNGFLYLFTIASPFVSVYAIRYLKSQYGARSLVLGWINLELLVCVSLIRPILFLANQMTETERITRSNSSLSINESQQLQRSPSQHLPQIHPAFAEVLEKFHQMQEKVEELELKVEKIKSKSTCNCKNTCNQQITRSAPALAISQSSSSQTPHYFHQNAENSPKNKSHNIFFLLLKVWMILFFNFVRSVVPFSGKLSNYCLNKIKSY